MILFITERPNTYIKLDPDKYFRGSYQSYFFYQCFSQGLTSSDIKLIFIDQFDRKKINKNIDIIIPLGREAFKKFDSKLSLDKARGSVFEETINKQDVLILPTFHPEELKMPYRMFLDSSVEKSYCFRQDIRKARDILINGYSRPEERFNLAPTLKDVERFVDEAIENKYLLGTDIEATGLSIEYAQIVCIGFAWNESDCIVIPLTDKGGASYWHQDLGKIHDLLNKLFKECRFLFQNGIGYDVPLLRKRGFNFPLKSFTDDTMLLHHSLNPELPHNIGFISSFYGQQPYWKHEFLVKKVHIHNMDQIEMRRYNARDCVALHQIYWPMIRELEEKQLEDVYALSMSLTPAVIEMQETGIKVDQKKLKSWQAFLNREIKTTFEELRQIKILPQEFNYSSGDHLTWLFYGKKSRQFEKLEVELPLYEKHLQYGYRCDECSRKINLKLHYQTKPNQQITKSCPKCKLERTFTRTDDPVKTAKPKSKTSENYKKLKVLLQVSKIKPFKPPTKFSIPTTKDGYATDKIAITKYIISINKRLEELSYLKRKTDKHASEDRNLRKTLKYLQKYLDYNALLKLKVAFYDPQYDSKGHRTAWQDGRIRPRILIQGTSTGRFSCKSPNLQQAPAHGIGSKMRDIFCAEEGRTLLSIDFSNLEVQVGARFMDDEVLIDLLEAGKNMHDENTKTFFGVKETNPAWKHLRFASKKIMFGRLLYGGSDNGIYTKVMTEVPKCGLTLGKFKEAVQNYMSSHPSYVKWVDKMIKLAHNERRSVNAYGRKRYLYGDISKIERQALNTPIQGSSADTINQDIVLIYEELLKRNLKSKLILAVHDEVIFECYDDELKEVYELAKEIMTRVREVNGHKFRIPIDSEIGKNWGSLKKFDEETMEAIGESKH